MHINTKPIQPAGRKWWRRGTGSTLIGAVFLVIAACFLAGFTDLALKASKHVKTQISVDAIADGSATYGGAKGMEFNAEAALRMAQRLAQANSSGVMQLAVAQSAVEDWSIIPGKKCVVLSSYVTGADTTADNVVIILPRRAHPKALDALNWAIITADDPAHGYNNTTENSGNPDYDCGTFVDHAYTDAGIDLVSVGYNAIGGYWETRTYYMKEEDEEGNVIYIPYEDAYYVDADDVIEQFRGSLEALGFQIYPLTGYDDLLEGDILLNSSGGHTEMYMGDYMTIGAHHEDGHPEPGDQTGGELSGGISVYGHAWKYVIRYVGF